jgi:hypothetical protein
MCAFKKSIGASVFGEVSKNNQAPPRQMKPGYGRGFSPQPPSRLDDATAWSQVRNDALPHPATLAIGLDHLVTVTA